jgi:hypothetical protein
MVCSLYPCKGEIFHTSLVLPVLLQDGYWVVSLGLSGQGIALTIHSFLAVRLQISRAMSLPLLCAFMAYYRVTIFTEH